MFGCLAFVVFRYKGFYIGASLLYESEGYFGTRFFVHSTTVCGSFVCLFAGPLIRLI